MGTVAPIALVTIEYAGRIWRLSSRPLDVTNESGTTHLYRGGLAPLDVYQDGPLSGTTDPQSQTFEALISTDVSALVADQHLTSEATAEVAQIEAGQTWEQRIVRLTGRVSVESDGFQGKPLRLKVTAADPASRPGVHPPVNAAMGDDTWGDIGANRREQEDGAQYPSVFGAAGTITVQGTTASVAAVPVIPITMSTNQNRFVFYSPWGDIRSTGGGWWTVPGTAAFLGYGIIADGWMFPGDVGTAQRGNVQGFRRQTGTNTWTIVTCPLVYALDKLGRIVTMVDNLVQVSAGVPLEDWEYAVAISPPVVGGVSATMLGGLTGAGSIIRWAIEKSDVAVDWRRASSALAVLDRYELAGFWSQQCDPWSWLVDNVFPLLPCSWVAGPQGVYPVIWRLSATAYNADATLTDGLNCTIDGPITYDGDPLSAHVLDYAAGLGNVEWRRKATWHGKPTRDTVRESMSLHTRRAQGRYGSQVGAAYRQLEVNESSDLLYADRSADRVLAWKSRVDSQPSQTLRIVSDGLHHRAKVAALEPGMAVALTSDRYSLADRVAFVRRSGWLGGVCYADLVILSSL